MNPLITVSPVPENVRVCSLLFSYWIATLPLIVSFLPATRLLVSVKLPPEAWMKLEANVRSWEPTTDELRLIRTWVVIVRLAPEASIAPPLRYRMAPLPRAVSDPICSVPPPTVVLPE